VPRRPRHDGLNPGLFRLDTVLTPPLSGIRGPATVKALLPTVESLTGGTSKRLVLAKHSDRLLDKSVCRSMCECIPGNVHGDTGISSAVGVARGRRTKV